MVTAGQAAVMTAGDNRCAGIFQLVPREIFQDKENIRPKIVIVCDEGGHQLLIPLKANDDVFIFISNILPTDDQSSQIFLTN